MSEISLRAGAGGYRPQVDPSSYVDPSAQIIGNVHIGPKVFVGPNAVIRADEVSDGKVSPVEIGPECNIQDGVIIHALGGTAVKVGRRSSLSHGCIVHGPCMIGEGCFVGFGAKVFDAQVGDGTFIGTGAVVQGVRLEAQSSLPPAAAVLSEEEAAGFAGRITSAQLAFIEKIVAANLALVERYKKLGLV